MLSKELDASSLSTLAFRVDNAGCTILEAAKQKLVTNTRKNALVLKVVDVTLDSFSLAKRVDAEVMKVEVVVEESGMLTVVDIVE